MGPIPQLDAARLALLALRASVSQHTPLPGPGVRVFPRSEVLAADAAAQLLAALPKPVACSATPSSDLLEVTCSALEPGTPDFDWHARGVALSREDGGFMGYLTRRRQANSTDVSVCCFGRDESLLVSLAAVDRWAEDYYIKRVNLRGDDVTNDLCTDWPQYREAKQRGAAGILIFSSPADSRGAIFMFGK